MPPDLDRGIVKFRPIVSLWLNVADGRDCESPVISEKIDSAKTMTANIIEDCAMLR